MTCRKANTLLLIVLIAFSGSACSSNEAARYADNRPVLELEKFFTGPTTAVGTVTDRSGNVIRRFRASAEGRWSEDEQLLTVDETWYWDDGEVEPRHWRWAKKEAGLWRGFEDDLVGSAEGRAVGNTMHWNYSMRVDTNAFGRLTISADDVMHLIDADNIINLVDMYFFGVYVGQVVLHIERGQSRSVEPASAGTPSDPVTGRTR